MHLSNILNNLGATPPESEAARAYFEKETVSHSRVQEFLDKLRKNTHGG
jgi:hypothetical protein